MDEFSIASIKSFDPQRLAQILQHEIVVSKELRVDDIEINEGRRTRRKAKRVVWNEERTNGRSGLFQHNNNIEMSVAWNRVEGDQERKTFPKYVDILNITTRSDDKKTLYSRLSKDLQVDESIYNQIQSYFDFECGKITVEPYCGRSIVSPIYVDHCFQIRAPIHDDLCPDVEAERVYESALRGNFSIDVPNQKGIGRSYSVVSYEGNKITVGASGLSSNVFQNVRNNPRHPLTRIYNSMLTRFEVDNVINAMQDYAVQSYGGYQDLLSKEELKRKLNWRIIQITQFEINHQNEALSAFQHKWRNIFQRRDVNFNINSEAKFSSYDGDLQTLVTESERMGHNIKTTGAQWMKYKDFRVQNRLGIMVNDWLEWIYNIKEMGMYDENMLDFTPFTFSKLYNYAREDNPPWRKRIQYVVIAIIIANGGCVALSRNRWYSPILQCCMDLDPQVLNEIKKKFDIDVTCEIELNDPTSDLGPYALRSSNTVAYVEMKWEGDLFLDNNWIECGDQDIIDENNESFINIGWGGVSKSTDSYFKDVEVHNFPKLAEYKRAGRNIEVIFDETEWRHPKRFRSYKFRIKVEEVMKFSFQTREVYEVLGQKYPHPFGEWAPHIRTYMTENLFTGMVRDKTPEPNEKWKWVESEYRKRGSLRRLARDWDGCHVSNWSTCEMFETRRLLIFLLRRISQPGPHPLFSKFDDEDWLESKGYDLGKGVPMDMCDCVNIAVSSVLNFENFNREKQFFFIHAMNRIEALKEIEPKFTAMLTSTTRLSMYALNLLPILMTMIPYGRITEGYIPIIIYTDVGMRVIPVSVTNVKNAQNMSDWAMYLEAYMSEGEAQANLTDYENKIRDAFINFYNSLKVESRYERMNRKYKLESLESWIGANCMGYFDCYTQMIPIKSPKRGFIFLVLTDSVKAMGHVTARLRKMFPHVWNSCRGVHIIDLRKGESVVGMNIDTQIKRYKRIDIDDQIDVWIISASNATFGNKHMLTKLLNKVG
uniref:Outer capsid protein VP2 n=1 Tax=Palyam virus TaxID=40059 RepID=A0A7R7V7H2_9REOV|nr:VP2 protein [Palyam virus]